MKGFINMKTSLLDMKTSRVTKRAPYRFRNSIRYVVGLATGLTGVVDMLSAIVPKLHWISILGAWTLNVHQGGQGYTVIVGFFLLMLSSGLMRGKCQAWHITIALFLLSALLQIIHRGPVLATAVPVLLATMLTLFARSFRARSDPPSV